MILDLPLITFSVSSILMTGGEEEEEEELPH